MWYDRWHESGVLIDKVTSRDLYDARISKMISITNMIEYVALKCLIEWSRDDFEIMNISTPRLKDGVQDSHMKRCKYACLF